jgi:hypothetical protein
MLSQLLNRPVTITTPEPASTPGKDDYGNQLDDDTRAIVVETVGELQQRQRSEDETGGVSDTSWLLVLPAGTRIAGDSIVTVNDLAYEVIGEPWAARNPRTGQESHIEATLRRTAGSDTTA